MRIFNRKSNEHPELFKALEKPLQQMQASADEDALAVASNFSHDPGIGEARVTAFLKSLLKWQKQKELDIGTKPAEAREGETRELDLKTIEEPRDFQDGWQHYVTNNVQSTHDPDFSRGVPVSDPKEELACVFNLNGLTPLFQWARDALKTGTLPVSLRQFAKQFEDYPNPDSTEENVEFVDRYMSNPAKQAEFLEAVVGLYDRYRDANPFHPIWLTKMANLEGVLGSDDDDAERWCQLLGISTEMKEGTWVIVLTFDSSQFEKLYRPTVLDGQGRFFFPAPEDAPTPSGLAADLAMDSLPPACEFIAKFPSLANAKNGSARKCARLPLPPVYKTRQIRERHLTKLRQAFHSGPSTTTDWLDRVQSS